MYEVAQEPASEAFRAAWCAAGQHLQRRDEGGISWLRADLSPPVAEHLSFRLGNQLFFVFLEVRGIDGPSSKDLFLKVASEATAVPAVLLMEAVGSAFRPVHGGWGFRDARNDRVIDPPTLVSNEPIEMSDWEVHDLAIQIVASYVDKSCAALSKQPSLHIDPSVWFRDEHGPAYVVVRSARFPRTDAPRPANLPAIMASCAKMSRRGFFASVGVASVEQATAPAAPGCVATISRSRHGG